MKKMRIVAFIAFVLGLLCIALFAVYTYQVSPVDKNSDASYEVVIESGMSRSEIGDLLEDKGLIRSAFFFKVYCVVNGNQNLKAATYLFSKNMSMDEIVESLEEGSTHNPNAVRLTFHEGRSVKDYASLIEENTNITADEFLAKVNDVTYLNRLIDKYWFLTDDILNDEIYYKLEGYLAPDTYEFIGSVVTAEQIIETMLDQESVLLEPYQDELQGSNIHEIITMASVVEQEGINDDDRKMIAGVFYNRLNANMNMGSDITTYYAFNEEMTGDLTSEMFATYNPYNTRSAEMVGRLPVGPICNPSINSIIAALSPTENDYLYFVADKNGNIYYTRSSAEHESKVAELKENGEWIW